VLKAHAVLWSLGVLATAVGITTGRALYAQESEEQADVAAVADHSEEVRHPGDEINAAAAKYSDEVRRLRDLSAGSTDPCLNALYVASKDRRVRALFLNKFTSPHYVFKSVNCFDQPSIPEYEFVLFDFDCRPDVICLVDPNFLVIVDVINARVVDIVDPYPSDSKNALLAALAKIRDASLRTIAVQQVELDGINYEFANEDGKNPDIHVDEGDTVRITLTSQSGVHDWTLVYVENGSEQVWAKTPLVSTGQSASVEFVANRTGTFDYFCSVGSHRARGMKGKFIITPR
jgi:plastocyanin